VSAALPKKSAAATDNFSPCNKHVIVIIPSYTTDNTNILSAFFKIPVVTKNKLFGEAG